MRRFGRILLGMMTVLVLVACGANTANTTPTATVAHNHDMAAMGDVPYDLLFLDSMVMHHQGAIEMAQDALSKAKHNELKEFAQNVIMQQDGEITQMNVWRAKWYPGHVATMGLDMAMGDMKLSSDESVYYDYRWIDAMISHHEAAVAMANDALQKSKNPDIINLAKAIVQNQGEEINKLKQWRAQW